MDDELRSRIGAGIVAVCVAIVAVPATAEIVSVLFSKPKVSESSEMARPLKNGEYTEEEYFAVGYKTVTKNDKTLEYGTTKVKTEGKTGQKKVTYKVTYKDGEITSREKVSEKVTQKAVDKVVLKGTKVLWHCKDSTSYDKNPYNDNYCTNSKGQSKYVSDSQARKLDPSYIPGQAGHPYYNSF